MADYVDALGFGTWLENTHQTLHDDKAPDSQELHDKLFFVGSEWFGNPLLYASENLFIRQANAFLDHISSSATNWGYWGIRHTTRYLSRFRVEGPDSSVIIRQRLAGFYGPELDLYVLTTEEGSADGPDFTFAIVNHLNDDSP